MAQIAALSQLAGHCPDAFEQSSEVVVNYLVKKVIMAPSLDMVCALPTAEGIALDYLTFFLPQGDENVDEEWFEDDEVPDELRSKILALKVLRNRCLAHKSKEQALEIATPVLKLFAALIDFEGSVSNRVTEK